MAVAAIQPEQVVSRRARDLAALLSCDICDGILREPITAPECMHCYCKWGSRPRAFQKACMNRAFRLRFSASPRQEQRTLRASSNAEVVVSWCRMCIVGFLNDGEHNSCPVCRLGAITTTFGADPLRDNLRADLTLQDILRKVGSRAVRTPPALRSAVTSRGCLGAAAHLPPHMPGSRAQCTAAACRWPRTWVRRICLRKRAMSSGTP